jgi:hypothetical protein
MGETAPECSDVPRDPEPKLLETATFEELDGKLAVLPRPVKPPDVVGLSGIVVLEKLNELGPVEDLVAEEELDGGTEVDGAVVLLKPVAVVFPELPPGPHDPVSIKLTLTPPVVPELVTVISSQKSGKTISSLRDTRLDAWERLKLAV